MELICTDCGCDISDLADHIAENNIPTDDLQCTKCAEEELYVETLTNGEGEVNTDWVLFSLPNR